MHMLHLLDYFFTIFHIAFVLFILSGWAYKQTRKAHLTAMLLTMISWLLLGLYTGHLGYCPLTDWHWDIKRALGEVNLPSSFIEYIVEEILRINFSKNIINAVTGFGLIFGFVMSTLTSVRKRTHLKEKSPKMA